jgi:hypothetical protein
MRRRAAPILLAPALLLQGVAHAASFEVGMTVTNMLASTIGVSGGQGTP